MVWEEQADPGSPAPYIPRAPSWCSAAPMRRLSVLFALIGLAVAVALLLRFNAAAVFTAMLSVGWRGAALLLAWQGLLFLLLGLAWRSVQPGLPVLLLIWGRMVRDAATACLPFSPLGGAVIGARAVMLRGAEWTQAAAGTVVDVSTELGAQLIFALFGAVALSIIDSGTGLGVPIAVGAVACLVLGALAWWSRGRIDSVMQGLADRLLGESVHVHGQLDRLRHEIGQLYAAPRRLLVGILLHLVGWFATGIGTWISLRLLDQPTPLLDVLALEALLDVAVAVAFVVPAAVGVQEVGYVGLGAIFGVPPDIALGVSLLRRAREMGWGVPVLGVWQWQEVRRL